MKKQIKQIIVLIGLMVLAITGLVMITGAGPKTPASIVNENSGILTVSETQYDFGTVSMANGKVSREFLLENKSDKSVQIGEVFTSCMCTEAVLSVNGKTAGPFGMQGHGLTRSANLTVRPEETLTVKAIFDPAAHGPSGVGPIERQVALYASSGKDPVILNFKAIVTP